jgi:hypothetical protein
MPSAKVHDLKVRPLQSVDLCFEIDGILGEQNAAMAMLGLPVTPFDFATFYSNLGVEQNSADPGRLKYDSQTIHNDPAVSAALLFGLRAESAKAVLDKAIAARENAFYQKYKNQAAVIAQMRANYQASMANPGSKPARLALLQSISQSQHDALAGAYTADGRTGVVKNTTSTLTGTTANSGTSASTSNGTVTGSSTNSSTQDSTSSAKTSGTSGTTGVNSTTDGTGKITTSGTTNDNQTNSGTTNTTNSGTANQTQSTLNTDYGFRHPSLENDAQYQRAQVSLMDEQFSQFMFGQNLPKLERVFANELLAIDLDVKRLQIAYLNTILMSPIAGTVTGLYKHLGDCVKAGEPVMRVENNAQVLLVGTLIFRGMLAIGSKVAVTTTIFGSTTAVTISGTVVSVRGHKSEEDEWNVLVSCNNLDGSGNPILPINYNFDFDDTTVTIS